VSNGGIGEKEREKTEMQNTNDTIDATTTTVAARLASFIAGDSPSFLNQWAENSLTLFPYMLLGYFTYCFVIHNTIRFFNLGPKIQPSRKGTCT